MAKSETNVRQMTILLEYKESPTSNFGQETYMMHCIAEAIDSYNDNRGSNSTYSAIKIAGIWVEPQETNDEGNIITNLEHGQTKES